MHDRTVFRYVACYCEENIWFLCQDRQFVNEVPRVVIISNELKACAFWEQLAGSGKPVFWDYHVFLLTGRAKWEVWDLDTALGMPVDFDHYMRRTFLRNEALSRQFAPIFRIMTASDYVREFSSDRSHMRDRNGKWVAPPPPWPMVLKQGGTNLMDLIDMTKGAPGAVMTFQDFLSTHS